MVQVECVSRACLRDSGSGSDAKEDAALSSEQHSANPTRCHRRPVFSPSRCTLRRCLPTALAKSRSTPASRSTSRLWHPSPSPPTCATTTTTHMQITGSPDQVSTIWTCLSSADALQLRHLARWLACPARHLMNPRRTRNAANSPTEWLDSQIRGGTSECLSSCVIRG